MKTTKDSLQRAASCGSGAEYPGYAENQHNDQEACSRMDSEGCPNGNDEDDRFRAQLHGMGEEPPTPAENAPAERLRRIQ